MVPNVVYRLREDWSIQGENHDLCIAAGASARVTDLSHSDSGLVSSLPGSQNLNRIALLSEITSTG